MNNLILLSSAVLSMVVVVSVWLHSAHGVCWDTGCQLDNWLVKGCEQYGMTERKRWSCNGGQMYTCCDGGGHSPETGAQTGAQTGELTTTGDMTYYNLGLTACGIVYTDNDMVAALSFDFFTTANPNKDPMCGRRVKIMDPTTSKHVVVTVVDKCEACKINDIDVSPAAFEKLKPKTVGRFTVQWNFI